MPHTETLDYLTSACPIFAETKYTQVYDIVAISTYSSVR